MVEFRLAVVGPDHLEDLSRLFELRRTTRHCRCMAFCSSGGQFAVGWYSGGNRRRFETMAAQGPTGVLALIDDEPVGWCACGPRSRFRPAERGRSSPLAGRPCDEDTSVWLVACTVISPDRPGQGLLLPLLRGAVDLARRRGAAAVEAWPVSTGVRRRGMEHVGREAVFVRLGFRQVSRPASDRTIVRLDFPGRPDGSEQPGETGRINPGGGRR
ncbi:hypothetical protein [Nakamurella sp.]|uniref:hypothetical protein n=1 Tax=Nakamurella sp. TaxID=1869182 RepID=UPI003B3AEFC3